MNTVRKIPGGTRVQVGVITLSSLVLCSIPVFWNDTKRGEDLFSQERPEAIVQTEEQLWKEFKESQQQQGLGLPTPSAEAAATAESNKK